MTSADWAILIPAIVAVLTAIAAYFKAHTATTTANTANTTANVAHAAVVAHAGNPLLTHEVTMPVEDSTPATPNRLETQAQAVQEADARPEIDGAALMGVAPAKSPEVPDVVFQPPVGVPAASPDAPAVVQAEPDRLQEFVNGLKEFIAKFEK
jgi:hypothetical protein